MTNHLDEVLDRARPFDPAELTAPEVTELLRRAFGRYLAQDQRVDADRLISLGVSLSRSHQDEAGDVALSWAANHDAAQSLVPSLALLFGLWRPAASPGHCSDSRLRRLMDLIEPAARDKTVSPDAAFLAIRVLDGALGCGSYAPATIDRVTAVGASLAGCLPDAEARTLLGDLLNAAARARATGSPDGA
jgi:hypothetical protein